MLTVGFMCRLEFLFEHRCKDVHTLDGERNKKAKSPLRGCNMVQGATTRCVGRRRRRRLELLPYHCHIPEQLRVSQFCFWDLIQYFPLRCVYQEWRPLMSVDVGTTLERLESVCRGVGCRLPNADAICDASRSSRSAAGYG